MLGLLRKKCCFRLNEMSKEKLIAILKEQKKRIPIETYQKALDYAITAIEQEHTQQSELKDNDVELVDAAFELGAQAFSECMHPHSHEFDHKLFREMKSEALANAKTNEG